MLTTLTQEPLPRTSHLAPEQWAAIDDVYARLAAAVAAGDRPLVVGSAKELAECVARVVLDARGRATADNADYAKVVAGAHQMVEHAIASDMPAGDPLRQIPEAAKKMAVQLAQLRNRFGTGHGRAVLHPVTDEVLEASVHGALVWVRWVLARLDTVLLGAVVPLIRDLGSSIFYGGASAWPRPVWLTWLKATSGVWAWR